MNELIVQKENVELIVNNAPTTYKENRESHDKCTSFGQVLLDTIESEGMSDELDEKISTYISRAKQTLQLMNERRSPITKLFDQVRGAYTELEKKVDPTSKESIPYLLQLKRNEYAALKLKEAEARRKEAERLQRLENARKEYPLAVESFIKDSHTKILDRELNALLALNRSITLDNFDVIAKMIKEYAETVDLPSDINSFLISTLLDEVEATAIRKEVIKNANEAFLPKYSMEIQDCKDNILTMLPGKKKELEEIAKAGDEERKKREEEMKKRETEEAEKAEAERKKRESEELEKIKAQQTTNQIGALFSQNATACADSYNPKTVVKQKITILGQQGILEIVNMWWINEGCRLSVEELSKKFKSQITYCEKLCNDKSDPKLIDSPYIQYEKDIKAK